MSCQTLDVSLRANARPSGSLAADARPAGMLSANARPQGSGLCRTFNFTFTPPSVDSIVTFTSDPMETFAGDFIVTF